MIEIGNERSRFENPFKIVIILKQNMSESFRKRNIYCIISSRLDETLLYLERFAVALHPVVDGVLEHEVLPLHLDR